MDLEIITSPAAIEWRVSNALVPYAEAVAEMERRIAAIRAGTAPELVWLLEHPPLYTAGTSARPEDLLAPGRLPVFKTGRGGQYTYHGPALNIDPALDHFRGIVPCGVDQAISGHGVTSLARLGVTASMPEVDMALRATFDDIFASAAACTP